MACTKVLVLGFREGFASGVLRMEWGPDNAIYVGQTNRGWASIGQAPYALERLVFNGKVPFDMKTVKVMENGFNIEFTQPVNRASAANPESYSLQDFTYKYHHIYGSPVTDLQTRTIYKVEVAQDGLSARIYVEGLRKGYINEIKLAGVKNTAGQHLLHDFAYYTLNEIPGGGHAGHVAADALTPAINLTSAKRPTKMPSTWLNGPDEILTVNAAVGMKYAETSLTVRAGSKVKFIFNNPDDMMHNLLIVKPNRIDAVAELANNMGLQGQAKGYVPDSEDVLFHTNLLTPRSSDIIYFIAPSKPGNYGYVCTFPGHAITMRGVLKVVE